MLRGESLVKTYGRRRVVDGLSVEAGQGEIVGLLGPNGAGKTTTFYMLVGLIRPDSGRVVLDGVDLTGMPTHRRARAGLIYLPQEPSIFRGLTVRENILAVLEYTATPPRERARIAERLIEQLGLKGDGKDLTHQRADRLSGGEKRRTEIARALSLSPKFLLLDEPFTGIDPKTIEELRGILQDLRRQRLGIVLTDHQWEKLRDLVDRCYVVDQGRILAEGPPAEVELHPAVREKYLGGV